MIGKVADAKFDRIDPELFGGFIERGFDRKRSWRGPGRPHRDGLRLIGAYELMRGRDVGAGIKKAGIDRGGVASNPHGLRFARARDVRCPEAPSPPKPRARSCTVSWRRPTRVNNCARVSSSRTGWPVFREASIAQNIHGHQSCPLQPKPPPRKREMTRMSESCIRKACAMMARVPKMAWVDVCTTALLALPPADNGVRFHRMMVVDGGVVSMSDHEIGLPAPCDASPRCSRPESARPWPGKDGRVPAPAPSPPDVPRADLDRACRLSRLLQAACRDERDGLAREMNGTFADQGRCGRRFAAPPHPRGRPRPRSREGHRPRRVDRQHIAASDRRLDEGSMQHAGRRNSASYRPAGNLEAAS